MAQPAPSTISATTPGWALSVAASTVSNAASAVCTDVVVRSTRRRGSRSAGAPLDERRRPRREDGEHEQLRLGLTVPAEGMDLLDAPATGHGPKQLEPIDADTDLTRAGANRGGAGVGLDPQGR